MGIKIIDIQRMSSEDGPGLRTTAFLKGCPLNCAWCHNPESISPKFQVEWIGARCIGCRTCENICLNKCLKFTENGVEIDRDRCIGCLKCTELCPTGAMNPKGKMYTVDELAYELLKDRAYFGNEGGITLSGGESIAQSESAALAKKIKEAGVSVAFDTCGFVSKENLENALEYADVVLYDLKLADSALHKKYTGVSNELILENFETVCKWAENGGRLWIRTPIIPNATDSVENIEGIAKILKGRTCVERWELCAFNNLCRDKYDRLGIEWEFYNSPLQTREHMEMLTAAAKAICGDTVYVRYSGALAEE